MKYSLLAGAVVAALLAPAAHAEDKAPTGWTGTGEFGLAIAKGNTDNQSILGKLGIKNDDGDWKHTAGAAFLFAKASGVDSAKRYELFGTSGKRVGPHSYVFGNARHENDDFGTYDRMTSVAAGYGYEAIKTQATQWTLEAGPGYRWATFNVTGKKDNGGILRGMSDFKHALNPSTALYNLTLIEAGGNNTFLRNDAGVMVKMSDALALKAGVELRHNTDVLPGKKKTDTLTTVNVVYGF